MKYFIASLLLPLSVIAQAHVTLEQPEAEAGKSYKAVLRVGHGCDGKATRQVIVTLPSGLRGAKPMPKPGWELATHRALLERPYESHGKSIADEVVEVRWTALTEANFLQDDWYDEFTLRATLPAAPATLWFKVRQVCIKGELNWSEVPSAAVPRPGVPAVRLDVVKGGGGG
ncbi:YcnI family protein [Paucibacter sp. DJ2R-2]|uniref:YcnI family copper-binding membrane protein n=1 Tax=Paucibacter sp. DJ2R-2 TaxID=2893558 RepID=UPI0021E3BCCA|nr:YcnI family protein [Paucibacter sp. DJ2R-2]MCV2438672.1 YcnI family protein [Paucibacter sp. DJ2R-2]